MEEEPLVPPPVIPPPPLWSASPKVYVISYNPIIENNGNKRLNSFFGWNDPQVLAADYIKDVTEASSGMVKYTIVDFDEIDGYMEKSGGYLFSDENYIACVTDPDLPNCRDMIDYNKMLEANHVCERVNAGEFSEVWVFGGPWMGLYESTMAGPTAIGTNGPAIAGTSCNKDIHIMGFSYERSVSEMLEDLGHRTEGTMNFIYGGTWPNNPPVTDWDNFTLYDKMVPGKAKCGTIHYPPNGAADYDWGNTDDVISLCDDWYNFPALKGESKQVDCAEWNCNGRGYIKWWMKHLPKFDGQKDGKWNNWWKYIVFDY
jgi:hypothetical protein